MSREVKVVRLGLPHQNRKDVSYFYTNIQEGGNSEFSSTRVCGTPWRQVQKVQRVSTVRNYAEE